jgi:hypothetical protein
MQIQGITFENTDVEVDGNTYEGCTFKHCTFVYRGGPPPMFVHCSVEGILLRFDGAAHNTLIWMTDLYHNGFRKLMEETLKNIRTSKPIRRSEGGH